LVDNKFGIAMKYPSLDPVRDWYLSSNPNTDSRITRKPQISNGQICGDATNGFYWCGDNGQIRIHVCPYTGKNDSQCECDQGVILTRGYMETNKDWRNFEISGEWRGKGVGDSLTLYGRGEYHYSSSSSADCDSCKGSSVKVNIDLTNPQVRFAFETWHVNYNHTVYQPVPAEVLAGYSNNNLYDQWFRFRYSVYNIENNTKVVCELDIAKGLTNEFFEVYKIVVPGGVTWAAGYDGAAACGCPTDTTPILWGGPIASYRWDDMDDGPAVKWRKLSIREINVEGSFDTSTPPPPSSTGTLSAKFRDIFNIGIRTSGDSCTGAASGTAPFVLKYDCETGTAEREISDSTTFSNRTRVMEVCKNSSSSLFGIKPRKVEISIAKVASPGGNAKVAIWDQNDNEVVVLGTVAVNSLSTDFSTEQTFYNETAPASLPNGIEAGWAIGVEYLGTGDVNYVKVRYDGSNPIDGANSVYANLEANARDEKSTRDLRMKVYI